MDKKILKTWIPELQKTRNDLIQYTTGLNNIYYLSVQVKRKHRDILCVSIFNINELTYVLFVCKRTNEFAWYDINEEKWRTSDFVWHLDGYASQKSVPYIITKSSKNKLLKYFEASTVCSFKDCIQYLLDIQQQYKKHKKNKEQIKLNRQIKKIRLPKKWDTWVEHTAMICNSNEWHYIFYNRSIEEGYCSNCNKNYAIPKKEIKHGTSYMCPGCNHKFPVKETRYIHSDIDCSNVASIIQKLNNQYMVCYFYYTKIYPYKNLQKPKIHSIELERVYFPLDNPNDYYIMRRDSDGWHKLKHKKICYLHCGMFQTYYGYSPVFPYNLQSLFTNTKYQYSALEVYYKECQNVIHPTQYLTLYNEFPCIEYLTKLGFYNLINHINCYNHYINLNGQNMSEILDMTKQEINQFKNQNISYDKLFLYYKVRENTGEKLTLSQLDQYYEAENYLDDIYRLCKNFNILTVPKIMSYIFKIAKKEDKKISDIAFCWIKHVKKCIKLGYSQSSYYLLPSNFTKIYAKIEANYELFKTVLERYHRKMGAKKIKKEYSMLKQKYGFENEKYKILPPKNAKQLKHEGEDLGICVASYVSKIYTEQRIILFIREKVNLKQPFYTLEIKENASIVQCQTKYHKNYVENPEIVDFLHEFQEYIRETKKEKQITSMAD